MAHADRVSPAARAASHPLFWAALGLLLLNDHVLKGAGVLPGELTGKLSDFAGMVVAPVILAALVGARGRGARALCLVAVGAGFAAINLLPPLAALIERAIPWSITVDPSDLVALPALGLAWWLLAEHREHTRMAAARIGLVVGAVACMATSYADEAGPCAIDRDCDNGFVCCDGLCVDTGYHDEHCGGCGIACSVGELCTARTCTAYESDGIGPDLDLEMSLPDGVEVDAPEALGIDPFSPRHAEMPPAH